MSDSNNWPTSPIATSNELAALRARWNTVRWGENKQDILDAGDKLSNAVGNLEIQRARMRLLLERIEIYDREEIDTFIEKGIHPDD